ncbi:TPA: family 16 glycosylhydrolase [Enterococcus faecium]|uniref:family 16 glycosylhydrolase n=2 Tax=Enterococcus gallinarum TaxID=1353 RepID=UPI00301E0F33|nr:family 16 glycosylhydrolase [Enterococcus faecium]
MVSKRNVLLRKQKYACKVQKYSIKKLSVGVASVLVGTALYLGNSVSAAEVTDTEVNSNNAALIEESSTVSEGATVENGSAASSEVAPTEVAESSTVSEGATVENGSAASSEVAPTEVAEPSTVSEGVTVENGSAASSEVVPTEVAEPSTVSEGATVENGSAASSEVAPTEVAEPSTVSEGATVENGPEASSGVASTEVEEPSEEVTAEKVNSELNRAADGDFEGSIVSNKSKWTMKPWGVSTIVTEGNNTFGKINGETKDEYILQKIPTTPGKKYLVTADLKVVARNATPTGAYFTAKEFTENRQQGKVYSQLYLDQTLKDWTKQTFEFTAEGAETLVGIVKWNPNDQTINTEKTEISIDNLVVVEKSESNYEIIWQEDFDKSELDKDTWSYMPGTVGRSEQQNYTTSKSNVNVENGNLVLSVTKREKEESNPRKTNGRTIKYDSGFINTSGKKDFLYGRIEMKAKLPKGKGAFPAFWLMGTSYGWPGGGEIDIMELIGAPTTERTENGETDPTDNARQSNKIIYGTPHFYYINGDVDKDGSYDPYELGGNAKIEDDFWNEYHIFGIDWSPERIDWYLDGVIYNSMNLVGDERLEAAARSINRPQILKLNLATGGDWAGDAGDYLADDNTSMTVDWIRWSQNEEQKKAAEAWYADAPKLTGVTDIVIKEGTNYDVLSNVQVDRDDYVVNASIDDEYMYTDTGELKLVNTIDKNDISNLKPGIYNVHYSVVPKNKKLNNDGLATGDIYKTLLKTASLIVLPESGLSGQSGAKLSTIKLPEGWAWEDDQLIIGEQEFYKVKFSTSEDSRAIFVNVPVSVTNQGDESTIGYLNKVVNGKFENDYVSSKREWEFKEGGNSIVQLDPKTGNSVGMITTNSTDEYVLQKIPTTPGKKYVLEADVLADSSTTLDGVYLTVKEVNNGKQGKVIKQLQSSDFAKGKKERYRIEFVAESNETYVGIVKWSEARNQDIQNSSICLDNVSVKELETYNLVWEDQFKTEELDQTIWGYELGNIRGNEQQHYSSSKDNVAIEDGNLVLKVTDRPKEDQYKNTTRWKDNARLVKYNSGSVRTQGKQEFLYGRIEAKIKLPKGKGVFPAFWTLGSDFHMDGRINPKQGYDWPSVGEIDIMELIGAPTDERLAEGEKGGTSNSNKNAVGTPHFYYANTQDGDRDGSYGYYDEDGQYIASSLGGNLKITEDFYDKYHVFGINWTPDKIEWYVDGVVYNTLNFSDPTNSANDKRLKAAAASLNRPQYIQFNLATGGNWAGDAGDYLAKDGTELKVDWVRWLQTDEQKVAMEKYYEDAPKLYGVENITILSGSEVDLLQNVSTDKNGYVVDFSIDNEFMFENTGAVGGRNEVMTVVKDKNDIDALKRLEPGVYNLHYTALPDGQNLNGWTTPSYKLARKTVFLTVLPKEGLSGAVGDKLSSVSLPDGWNWNDGDLTIDSNASYVATFKQKVNSGVSDGRERKIFISIPSKFIKLYDSSKAQSSIEKDLSLETEKDELDYVSLNKVGMEKEGLNYRKNLDFSEKGNEILDNHSASISDINISKGESNIKLTSTEHIKRDSHNKVLPKTGERSFYFSGILGSILIALSGKRLAIRKKNTK